MAEPPAADPLHEGRELNANGRCPKFAVDRTVALTSLDEFCKVMCPSVGQFDERFAHRLIEDRGVAQLAPRGRVATDDLVILDFCGECSEQPFAPSGCIVERRCVAIGNVADVRQRCVEQRRAVLEVVIDESGRDSSKLGDSFDPHPARAVFSDLLDGCVEERGSASPSAAPASRSVLGAVACDR
jgi:hypothetical protein